MFWRNPLYECVCYAWSIFCQLDRRSLWGRKLWFAIVWVSDGIMNPS
jgi:hypothetical protein